MPGRDPLSQIGDLAAIQANVDEIIELVKTVSATIKSVPSIAVSYKDSGGGVELKKNTDDLVKANKELLTAQEQLDIERKKSLTLEGDIAKQLAIQRELNKQKSTDMRAEARDAAGLNDAYRKLELQYKAAQREAKNLASTPGTSQGAIDAANKNAKGLSDQLKAIDNAVGQNQRKVGDYVGAISILDKTLTDTKNKLEQFGQQQQQNASKTEILQKQMLALAEAGQQDSKTWLAMKSELEGLNTAQATLIQQTASLANQEQLLNTLTSQQAKGFMSVTMEIRANEKALQTLRAAGMEGTEAFEQLQQSVAGARREFNEFQKNQALLESASPKLAALTLVAKGLGGAYALAAGGSALLANGDEKVEKELNKLVAIMTILQGLNEVHELMEKRGAVATIANGVAQGFKNFIMTGSVKGLQASTAAQAENTIVQEENTMATEADTVAKEAQAVATDEVAVATEGASSGMVGFRIALMATGIGALLLLLPAVASAMDLFKKSTKEAAKEEEEIAELVQKMNDILMEQIKLLDEDSVHMKKNLENALALAQKNNQNYYDQFAIKKQITDLDVKTAENDLKHAAHTNDLGKAYQAVKGEADKLTSSLDPMLKKQEELIAIAQIWKRVQTDPNYNSSQAYYDIYYKFHKNMTEQEVKDEMDGNDKKVASTKKLIEDKKKLTDNYDKATLDQTGQEIEKARFSAEEQRELTKAMAVTKAQAIIDANGLILSNEKSTQQQRLAAESSNLLQQLNIIEAEKKARLDDPSLTKDKRDVIKVESGAAEVKARTDGLEKIRLINEDYRKREQAAEYDILKSSIETQSKAAEETSNNVKLPLQTRLAAFQEFESRQRQLINADADFQKQKAGQTANELLAIEVARQAKLQELYTTAQAKGSQILLSSLDQMQKSLEGHAQMDGIKGEVSALEALNQKYKEGTISAAAFRRQREQISSKAGKEALQLEIVALQYISGEYKKNGQDATAIDKLVAENKKRLVEGELSDDEKKLATKKALQDKEIELAKQTEDTIASFVKGGFERSMNNVQRQIDLSNKYRDTETKNIATSTLSASQKAAYQLQLDKQTAQSNEELSRKQRDIKNKEAQFDRDKALFDITANTAVSILKTAGELGYPAALPFIAVAAATGIIETAAILAKPLPKYAGGVDSSPAGPAIVGEKGEEMRIDPSGKVSMTPGHATLTYLEAGTRIIPHDKLQQYRSLDPTINTARPNNQLEKKIDRLTNTMERIGQEQLNATKKQKAPVINVHNDVAFWAHVKNSTQ